jgi:hypothetical protein
VVSSAIVNKPPPAAIANLLARRNKIHHLNHQTDETLLNFFDKDPGDTHKTAGHNHVTMPARNYAMLTENSPHNPAPPPSAPGPGDAGDEAEAGSSSSSSETLPVASGRPRHRDGHKALHPGERNAGTKHKAAGKEHGRGNDGGLDVCIRVETDQHNREGHCEGYGLTVPALSYTRGSTPSVHTSHSSGSSHGEEEQQQSAAPHAQHEAVGIAK